jgi:tetratricopeptide (TPR) repeat protein
LAGTPESGSPVPAGRDEAEDFYREGLALYQIKEYKGAARILEKAINLAPERPLYYQALAFSYSAVGDTVNARRAAEEGLRLQPDNTALSELLKQLK